MDAKMCRKCGEVKVATEFHKGNNGNLHCYCKKCAIEGAKLSYRKLNQKEWMAQQANDTRIAMIRFLDFIKNKYNCIVCGENNPCCLVFHHIDPQVKVGDLAKVCRTKNIVKTILEVNKCVILCSNCHAKFHAGLINFDESKKCQENLENCRIIYKTYKENIGRKKREKKQNQQKYCSCGNKIYYRSNRCVKCSNTNRKKDIDVDQFLKDFDILGCCKTARKYNVSHTTIRRWIKRYTK